VVPQLLAKAASETREPTTAHAHRQASKAREAKAKAFLSVPLFKAIFEQWNSNQLPPTAGLEREIVSLGVAEKQKERARQIFERSAQDAGFLVVGQF
jgi:hypothetical protein